VEALTLTCPCTYRSGNINPLILNLGTTCRWAVSLVPWLLYIQEKSLQYLLSKRLHLSDNFKYYNQIHLSFIVIQVVNTKCSQIVTVISVITNVNFINFTWKTCVYVYSLLMVLQHGHQTFSWQRATPVIAGCTWKNNSNGTPNCLNYYVIFRVHM
jgi:hypothetical protein